MSCFSCKFRYPQIAVKIDLFEGIDDIKLNESKFNQVKKTNPEFEYSKHFEKHEILPILLGHYFKRMYSEEKGITVYFKKKWILGCYYPCQIELNDKYTGKSTLGIGIGSSFDTITKLINTTNEVRLYKDVYDKFLSYEMKVAEYQVIEMGFYGEMINDTARVNYIRMEFNDLR